MPQRGPSFSPGASPRRAGGGSAEEGCNETSSRVPPPTLSASPPPLLAGRVWNSRKERGGAVTVWLKGAGPSLGRKPTLPCNPAAEVRGQVHGPPVPAKELQEQLPEAVGRDPCSQHRPADCSQPTHPREITHLNNCWTCLHDAS